MRTCAALFLLVQLLSAEPLVEVGKARYVGTPVAMEAIALGRGHLPLSLTQRGAVRGHVRIIGVNAADFTNVRLGGTALGMCSHRTGVLWVTLMKNGSLSFKGLRYEPGRVRASSQDYGTLDVKAWRNMRLLALGATRDGPVAVCAHPGGLEIVHVERRVKTTAHTIPNGSRFTAASSPADVDGDGKIDIFVAGRGIALTRLQHDGRRAYTARAMPWTDAAFLPRAIAAESGRVAVAGTKGGRAALVVLGERRRSRRGPRTAPVTLDLGAGSLRHVRFLGNNLIAVAGQQARRAWVGVVSVAGGRARLVADLYVSGKDVLSLGTNPARRGWTLAAGSDDMTATTLRLRADPALPRDWHPFKEPKPAPAPVPVPVPQPAPQPVPDVRPVDPPAAEQPVPVPVPSNPPVRPGARKIHEAFFPRVVADPANGLDTEITLVHIGERPRTLALTLIDDRGREIAVYRARLTRGQRKIVSVAAMIRNVRVASFDGYARIKGTVKADLVAEASPVLGRRRGEPSLPHWR